MAGIFKKESLFRDEVGFIFKNQGFKAFFGNQLLIISSFLHDGKRQQGASFEYGGIFGKNVNLH